MAQTEILREHADPAPRMLDADVADSIAWTRATLAPATGHLTLDATCLDELRAVAATLGANPLPIEYLSVDEFDLPACRNLMDQAKKILEESVGFVIVDRLPLDEFDPEQAKAIYWLLGQMLARPVAQNWTEGKLLYDVRDSGKSFGYGVRPDITNRHQNFHTDNSYNLCPPRYVGLLCLEIALEGGLSGLVSFLAAHNEMRRREPELLARLYLPFLFDRQKEHAPDDAKIISHPLFAYGGSEFIGRLSRGRVEAGHELAGEALDAEGVAALDALEAILENPEFNQDFVFERGQMQFVHNFRCGHRRTGFRDDPNHKRHLVRLWLRDEGRRFYNG